MNEQVHRGEGFIRLKSSLSSTISYFNMGEDTAGINGFLECMEALDGLIDSKDCGEELQICSRLLPALESLHLAVRNQDIIGITDLLEYTFIPLADEWLAECETP
jgi:hypothetical protein